MENTSVNKFRENLKTYVEHVVEDHVPLKVTRRSGEDFIVLAADDWARDQETLYVLQNSDLMQQISTAMTSHVNEQGYQPTDEEINEILSL